MGVDFFRRVLDLALVEPDVRISFDDGNSSDLEVAMTELRDRGLTADFFPLAGRLGHGGSVGPDGLQELVAAGMTVGSHGMSHRPWRRLADVDVRREFDEARATIEAAAGVRVTAAACPLGAYDRATLSALRARRYTVVYTSDRAYAGPRSWLQPRFSLLASDTLDDVEAILGSRPGPATRARSTARVLAKRLR